MNSVDYEDPFKLKDDEVSTMNFKYYCSLFQDKVEDLHNIGEYYFSEESTYNFTMMHIAQNLGHEEMANKFKIILIA